MVYRLGRVVEHDERSRNHPARRATQPRTVLWPHTAPVLDQGDLGMCTGAALAQCLNTTRFRGSRPRGRYLDILAARALYSKATAADDIPGQWPPTDTGSSGLAVCKAGVAAGYLTAYHHAFGFQHFTEAIALSPVIAGTAWYDAMFTPDTDGFIRPAGQIAGGHEYAVLGINHRGRYITILNSWGPGWGRNGRARIRFDDFAQLLADDGDCTVPIGRA